MDPAEIVVFSECASFINVGALLVNAPELESRGLGFDPGYERAIYRRYTLQQAEQSCKQHVLAESSLLNWNGIFL